jgi:hypothetical protein
LTQSTLRNIWTIGLSKYQKGINKISNIKTFSYDVEITINLFLDIFNFHIVNFPFICSKIPAAPVYGVYIPRVVRYSRACDFHQDFIDKGLLLKRKLLNQEFLFTKLKSSLRKLYGRQHDLVDRYGISVSQITTDMLY